MKRDDPPMISLEEAREKILASLPRLGSERVPLSDALGSFASEDVRSDRNVPSFDNSAFDGYAVHASDVATATAAHPATLRVIGIATAGSAPGPAFPKGSCLRIFTGAPMPAGADAVVMQEDTRTAGPDSVDILDTVRPREGVRFAGEDVRPGDVLVRTGHRLNPPALALVASTGIGSIPIHRRPSIFLLSTGSELIEPGLDPQPGQIHDSNGVLLDALARNEGAKVIGCERVTDEVHATVAALQRASAHADVVITSGGVSVGDADLLRPAITALGGSVDLWRIAIKPGKPFAYGRLGAATWFGLPGNPVAAFVTWHVLVRPALRHLAGSRVSPFRSVHAHLGQTISNGGDRRHFIRVIVDEEGLVRPAGTQASHVHSSMAAANALLDVPPSTTWETGRAVRVDLLD